MELFKMVYILVGLPFLTMAITTIHHDKPEEAKISKMVSKMQASTIKPPLNITITNSERQKRLLPYANFYLAQNINQPLGSQRYQFESLPKGSFVSYNKQPVDQEILYQPNTKYTPFLESNAIPGPFVPMLNNNPPQRVKVEYVPIRQEKLQNYDAIYEKLAQFKLSQQTRQPSYYRHNPQRYNTESKPLFNQYQPVNNIQPTKTVVETYTATNIDVPTGNGDDSYQPIKNYQQIPSALKNFPSSNKYEVPKHYVIEQEYEQEKQFKPYIILPNKPVPVQKPIIFIQRKPIRHKPVAIVDEKYVADKFVPQPVIYEHYPENPKTVYIDNPVVQQNPKTIYFHHPKTNYGEKLETPKNQQDIVKYQPVQYEPTSPKYEQFPIPQTPTHISTENTNTLSHILKQLQDTNTLPHTLTPDNIDNSIKTLVRILEALRKQQKFSKPIVVSEEQAIVENEAEDEIEHEVPGTVTQSFPADTPDGGTPGKPGIDYPALSTIPPTSFNCKMQRYKGFFGDPDTNCQVWHYCDLNGGQASFLCPNGTIFSQVALTCDWWYNVKCASTLQLYVLNERLYKYILPLAPKFPEDYSGPLVDKYLALKFQEMEEKMRKEKKGKENADKEETDELQKVDDESTETPSTVEENEDKSDETVKK